MSALNVDEIKRDATNRLDLAKKTEELQVLVDRMYPGYKVVLSKNGSEAEPQTRTHGGFRRMTQLEQIETVLKEHGTAMKLSDLFHRLQGRGSRVSLQSLMSLLSAGKKAGRFRKAARGIWGLPEQIRSAEEMFDNLEEEK